jgi:5-methyltetrahydrofolate--homocysteine methyltransferase
MPTVIRSQTCEVVIGPDRPFVIIGERINPTGRSALAAEMAAGNFERVRSDAIAQVNAGARVLDVNAGIPLADEPELLAEAIRVVQGVVDVPLSIDSSIVAALEKGLSVYKGKPLVNSVTGEAERLERVLPLVKKYGAAVVGIANDETGISEDPAVRFAVAKKIVAHAEAAGILRDDVIIDPLAMPVGAMRYAAVTLFKIVRRIREELGVNTICGASNISFGMPDRPALSAAFLSMAIAEGMTCAITNPLDEHIRKAILAADVMMGHDENCQCWVRQHLSLNDGARNERAARRERKRASVQAAAPESVNSV